MRQNLISWYISNQIRCFPSIQHQHYILPHAMQNYQGSLETFFVEVPTIWISKGPKQTFFFVHWALRQNFKGTHWIFRGPRPLPPGPQGPWLHWIGIPLSWLRITYTFLFSDKFVTNKLIFHMTQLLTQLSYELITTLAFGVLWGHFYRVTKQYNEYSS